jgi:hypothetical protein
MEWVTFKQVASDFPLSKDALHIYAALAIQFAACISLGRSLASIWPWGAVLILELVNEAMDLLLEPELYIHEWQIEGSIHDILNTMALPTILMLLVRHAPRLFTQPRDRSAPKVPRAEESE